LSAAGPDGVLGHGSTNLPKVPDQTDLAPSSFIQFLFPVSQEVSLLFPETEAMLILDAVEHGEKFPHILFTCLGTQQLQRPARAGIGYIGPGYGNPPVKEDGIGEQSVFSQGGYFLRCCVEVGWRKVWVLVQVDNVAHDGSLYWGTEDFLLYRLDGDGVHDLPMVGMYDGDRLPGCKCGLLSKQSGKSQGACLTVDGEAVTLT